VVDIGGKGEVLRFESVLRELKRVENENLFADFPIGATMQDGGKRRLVYRGAIDSSNVVMCVK